MGKLGWANPRRSRNFSVLARLSRGGEFSSQGRGCQSRTELALGVDTSRPPRASPFYFYGGCSGLRLPAAGAEMGPEEKAEDERHGVVGELLGAVGVGVDEAEAQVDRRRVVGSAVCRAGAELQLSGPHPGGRRRRISLPLLPPSSSSILAWQRRQCGSAGSGWIWHLQFWGQRGWCQPRWVAAALVWGYGCSVFEASPETL